MGERDSQFLFWDRHLYFFDFQDHGVDRNPIWFNMVRDPVAKLTSRYYFQRQIGTNLLKLIIFKDSQRHYFLLAFWGSSSVFAGTEDFFQTLVRADYYMVRRAKSREVWLSKPHGQCIMDPADLECNFQNGTVELWVDFQIVSVKWNWNFWQGFLPGTLIDQEMRYNISWV